MKTEPHISSTIPPVLSRMGSQKLIHPLLWGGTWHGEFIGPGTMCDHFIFAMTSCLAFVAHGHHVVAEEGRISFWVLRLLSAPDNESAHIDCSWILISCQYGMSFRGNLRRKKRWLVEWNGVDIYVYAPYLGTMHRRFSVDRCIESLDPQPQTGIKICSGITNSVQNGLVFVTFMTVLRQHCHWKFVKFMINTY